MTPITTAEQMQNEAAKVCDHANMANILRDILARYSTRAVSTGGYIVFEDQIDFLAQAIIDRCAPTDAERKLALAVEALRGFLGCVRGHPYMSGKTVWGLSHGARLNEACDQAILALAAIEGREPQT